MFVSRAKQKFCFTAESSRDFYTSRIRIEFFKKADVLILIHSLSYRLQFLLSTPDHLHISHP